MLKKVIEDLLKAIVFVGYIYWYLPCQNLNWKIKKYIPMNLCKHKNNKIHTYEFM